MPIIAEIKMLMVDLSNDVWKTKNVRSSDTGFVVQSLSHV